MIDTFFRVNIKKNKIISFKKLFQAGRGAPSKMKTLQYSKTTHDYTESGLVSNQQSLIRAKKIAQPKIVITMGEVIQSNNQLGHGRSSVQVPQQAKKSSQTKGSSITINLFNTIDNSSICATNQSNLKGGIPKFIKSLKPSVLTAQGSEKKQQVKEKGLRSSYEFENAKQSGISKLASDTHGGRIALRTPTISNNSKKLSAYIESDYIQASRSRLTTNHH